MDKISYIELINLVLSKKKILLFSLLGFFIGGILMAITSPVEYQSSAITISEAEEGGLGGLGQLGGLAGMAGINLPSSQGNRSTFSPDMYPEVVKSRSFLAPIVKEEFYFESLGQTMTLQEYYLQERPGNIFSKSLRFIKSLPSRVINIFNSPKESVVEEESEENNVRIIKLSSQDEYAIGQLRNRIQIDIEKRFMTLNVNSPEPLISAELNSIVLDRLIGYATSYKTEKQRNNLEFIEERLKEAEENFKDSQLALATFRDANQGIVTQRARTREEFLQAEFNMAFNVYNSLKQEVEQARIQLKKETPLFTTFEPAAVPLGPSSPNTPLILIISIFLGLFVGLGIILLIIIKEFYFKTFNI